MYIHLFPLLDFHNFRIPDASPATVAFSLLFISFFIGLLVFLNSSKKVQQSKFVSSGNINIHSHHSNKPKGDDGKEFAKLVKMFGLTKQERYFLMEMFEKCEIKPSEITRHKDRVDDCFNSIYKNIKRESGGPEEELSKIALLFSIRNAIEFQKMLNEIAKEKKNRVPRKYRRKKAQFPCMIHPVTVSEVKTGLKKEKKLTVSEKKFAGALIDISAGGCAVAMRDAIKAGVQLKLEFKTDRANVAALGLILRVNKNPSGAIAHIKFMKVPPKSLQSLNEYIYNYSE